MQPRGACRTRQEGRLVPPAALEDGGARAAHETPQDGRHASARLRRDLGLIEATPSSSWALALPSRTKDSTCTIYGVEPAEANVLNGGKPGPHLITGNGVGFKPDILDMDIMEKVLEVKGEDVVKMAQQLVL
ncbi:hypothetical protein ZWY2020_054560 [Hordeum vulgare]|nr:hypothetical protein ZWY2020_054560 [Hordeum vulgare]